MSVDDSQIADIASEYLDGALNAELKAQTRKVVAPIVTEALAAVMTEERLAELRQAAQATVERDFAHDLEENATPVTGEIAMADASNIAKQDQEEEEPEPYYDDLDEFVQDFITVVWFRSISKSTVLWCREWWKHPEAMYRLDQLWKSWESMRISDPACGQVAWLVNYADPTMRVLMDPDGTFKGCDIREGHKHRDPVRLECVPMPPMEQYINDSLNYE